MKTNYRIVTNGRVFRVEYKVNRDGWQRVMTTRSARGETWDEQIEFWSVEAARAWIKGKKSEKWEVVK